GHVSNRPSHSSEPDGVRTEAQHDRMVVDFNRTEAPYPSDRTVADLFEDQVARTPDAELPVLTPQERHTLLVEWNATQVDVTGPATIVEAFETAAARTPDAPACTAGGRMLTFRQLNERADV